MRADAAANRDAILASARTLYAERGGATSLRGVADHAGVGIATLYRHFPTLLDLRIGLVEQMHGQVADVVETSLDQMRTSAEDGWRNFVLQLAAMDLAAVLPHMAQGFDPNDLPPRVQELRANMIATVDRVVSAAKEAGLVDASVTAVNVHLGVAWITRPLPPLTLTYAPDQTQWMLDTLLRGMRPDA